MNLSSLLSKIQFDRPVGMDLSNIGLMMQTNLQIHNALSELSGHFSELGKKNRLAKVTKSIRFVTLPIEHKFRLDVVGSLRLREVAKVDGKTISEVPFVPTLDALTAEDWHAYKLEKKLPTEEIAL